MEIKVKVVKTRDSATNVLRKLGVKRPAYNLFITKLETGSWEVNLPKVHEAGYAIGPTKLVQPPVTLAKAEKAAKRAKKTEKKLPVEKPVKFKKEEVVKAPVERKVSISSVAEAMILDGKTNEEVFKALQLQFKLDDGRKTYPSWYRSRLKRQGKMK